MATMIDDDLAIIEAGITRLEDGGTEANLGATGPGVLIQPLATAPFAVLPTPIGSLVVGSVGGVPVASSVNNTATRKFAMEQAIVTNTPIISWVELIATDIASGALPTARGGAGADMSATTGLWEQATSGAAITMAAQTGTGAVVRAVSPTITGAPVMSGAMDASAGAMTIRARSLTMKENAPGTGAFIFDASPIADGATREFLMPNSNGTVLVGVAVGTTVGSAGAASALPAQPTGYIEIILPSGSGKKIPYYDK